jgi:hypothetical protein
MILPREAGEGDRAERGGGGVRSRRFPTVQPAPPPHAPSITPSGWSPFPASRGRMFSAVARIEQRNPGPTATLHRRPRISLRSIRATWRRVVKTATAEQRALRLREIPMPVPIREPPPLRERHPVRKPPIPGADLSSHHVSFFLLNLPPCCAAEDSLHPPLQSFSFAGEGDRSKSGGGGVRYLKTARPFHHASRGPPSPLRGAGKANRPRGARSRPSSSNHQATTRIF